MYKKRLKNLKKFKFFFAFFIIKDKKRSKWLVFWLNLRPSDGEKNEPADELARQMGFAKASKSPKKDYFKVSI